MTSNFVDLFSQTFLRVKVKSLLSPIFLWHAVPQKYCIIRCSIKLDYLLFQVRATFLFNYIPSSNTGGIYLLN